MKTETHWKRTMCFLRFERGMRMNYKEWATEENFLRLGAWARDGLTDKDMAHNIGIAPSTFNEWKKNYPEFMDTLKKNKEVADIIIENALFKRATGYDTIEETIEYINQEGAKVEIKRTSKVRHIPAEITAQIFWLKNRKRNVWRDKQLDEDEDKTNEIIKELKDFEVKFVNGGANENDTSN